MRSRIKTAIIMLLATAILTSACGQAVDAKDQMMLENTISTSQPYHSNESPNPDRVSVNSANESLKLVDAASKSPSQSMLLSKNVTDNMSPMVPVRKQDLLKSSPPKPSVAAEAIKNGVKPGAFQNVNASLKTNVIEMDDKAYQALASALTDNKLNMQVFGRDTSKLYVSSKNGVAVKFAENTETGDVYAIRPGYSEVIENFQIPDQTVALNAANISWLTEGITVSAKKVPSEYALQMPASGPDGAQAPPPPSAGAAGSGDDALEISFSERLYKGYSDSGNSLDFKIGGKLELITPRIVGSYSKFSGYRLEFLAGEKFNLSCQAIVNIDETFKIPIQSFEIPAGKFGSAGVGIYLLIDVNGEMRLTFEVNQGLTLKAGVKGGTFFYIPTSVKPVFELERWCQLDSSFNGELHAFVGPSAELKLVALGFDLLEIVARAGIETDIAIDGNMMDLKAGFRIKVYGEVVGKNFKAVNKYIGFLDEKRQHTGKYEMKLTKACAYTDQVEGNIMIPVDLDHKNPYKGDVTIRIVDGAGTEKSKKTIKSDSKGNFTLTKANLYKGDKVYVLVPESVDNWYGPLETTFPFKDIDILYADYYGEELSVQVSTSVKNSSQTLAISDSEQGYTGQATLLLTPMEPDTGAGKGEAEPGGNKRAGTDSLSIANKAISVPFNLSNSKFTGAIKGNPIKPSMQAKIRIDYKGFVIESQGLMTDGLMVTPLRTDGYQIVQLKDANREDISGTDSFIIISTVRSSKTPTGEVKLTAGVDLPHRNPSYGSGNMSGIYTVNASLPFREQLLNPVYYYDKTVRLASFKPSSSAVKQTDSGAKIEDSVMAIAETGGWKTSAKPLHSSVKPDDIRGDRHSFESVSYLFEGIDMGYYFIEPACRFCCFSDGGYRFDDDSYWDSDAALGIRHSQMDINSISGLGQGVKGIGNPGLVVNPGRLDIEIER